jgi:hypothetical protein
LPRSKSRVRIPCPAFLLNHLQPPFFAFYPKSTPLRKNSVGERRFQRLQRLDDARRRGACRHVLNHISDITGPSDFSAFQRPVKQRIRDITRRAKNVSMETTMEETGSVSAGLATYFGFCEKPLVLISLTRCVRLRLRAAMWRQWKTPRRRRAALLALGVRPRLATNTAGSGRGPWYLARAKALSVGLSNAYFKSLGLPTLIDGF